MWERDEHGNFVLAVGRRRSGIGLHKGPDLRPGDDRTSIDTRPDPGHAIEFGGRQFGVDATLRETDDGDHDGVGRAFSNCHTRVRASPSVVIADRWMTSPPGTRIHVSYTGVSSRRFWRTAADVDERFHSRPVRTPHSRRHDPSRVATEPSGDAGNRPGEVADQGAKRRVEWREVPAPKAIEESHGFVRRPFERPSGDRSLWPRGC